MCMCVSVTLCVSCTFSLSLFSYLFVSLFSLLLLCLFYLILICFIIIFGCPLYSNQRERERKGIDPDVHRRVENQKYVV